MSQVNRAHESKGRFGKDRALIEIEKVRDRQRNKLQPTQRDRDFSSR